MTQQLSAQIRPQDQKALRRKLAPGYLTGGPLADVLSAASENAQRVAAQGVGGTAAKSIMSDVSPTTARVFSLMSDARATSIELGRDAGGTPVHPEVLERWARRVGFSGSLYALARRIARRGVKGRFFMQAALRSTDALLPQLLRGMAVQVERRFGGSKR